MLSVVGIVPMKPLRRTARLLILAALPMLSVVACAKGDVDGETPADTSAAHPDSSPSKAAAVAQPSGSERATGPSAGSTPGLGATDGVPAATGVFTVAQAASGQEVYTASCAQCHTMAQHSGSAFAAAWNGRRLSDLYEIIRGTMPLDNPGGLSDQEYIDVVAYMLQLNGVPAGKAPLRADAAVLKNLRIEVKPAVGAD
jgi:mono/diheme cytochrome c family protein